MYLSNREERRERVAGYGLREIETRALIRLGEQFSRRERGEQLASEDGDSHEADTWIDCAGTQYEAHAE
jgi:hypothetical protein